MEQRPASGNVYHDNLAKATELLESLGHSEAFEHMLYDYAAERSENASFDLLPIHRGALPTDLTRHLLLSDRFNVTNFQADLIELRNSEESATSDWSLQIRCHLGSVPILVASGKQGAKIDLHGADGQPVSAALHPTTAAAFLIAIASTSLGRDSETFINTIPAQTLTSLPNTRETIGIIGQRLGVHTSSITANLMHPKFGNRALIVAMNETETCRTSALSVTYHLACELVPKRYTEMLSTQRETMLPTTLQNRFSERHHTDIPPDQLFYALDFTPPTPPTGIRVTPEDNRLQYDLISSSIMSVLRDYLAPYANLDKFDHSVPGVVKEKDL